jgi:hypothetical protein
MTRAELTLAELMRWGDEVWCYPDPASVLNADSSRDEPRDEEKEQEGETKK